MQRRKVIIIGGGIGGLTLANALLKNFRPEEMEVKVYERDKDPNDRSQGYGVGLRGDMGLKVLDAIGFAEDRQAICLPTRSFYFTTPAGWILMLLGTPSPASPYYQCRVARPALRKMLLSHLPEGTVVWGTQALEYRVTKEGATVVFGDGTSETADLVVACDGTRSKLRAQMVGRDERMLDVALISGRIPAKQAECKYVGESAILFCIGNGESVFATLNEENECVWTYGFQSAAGSLRDRSPKELHQMAMSAVQSWKQEPIARMVRATDPATASLRELADQQMPSHARDGRVVLLGDACHPMTPYLGLGANTAMEDALSLATSLQQHSDVDAALREYESVLLQRGAKVVHASRRACLSYHRAGWLGTIIRNIVLCLAGLVIRLLPTPKRNQSKK